MDKGIKYEARNLLYQVYIFPDTLTTSFSQIEFDYYLYTFEF